MGKRLVIYLLFFIFLSNYVNAFESGVDYPDYEVYHGYWSSNGDCSICQDTFVATNLNFSKIPVLLVPGWSNTASEVHTTEDEWTVPTAFGNGVIIKGFEKDLRNDGYEVWRLKYWPANLSNRKNAGMVSQAIDEILDKGYRENGINQVDVISHSMGGLAVRGYIQNMGIDKDDNPVLYNNDIRKYIIISGPLYGSYFANIINNNTDVDILSKHQLCKEFVGDYKLTGNSEATHDMEIGSDFTWEVNNGSFNDDIDYLTISGNQFLPGNIPFKDYEYCLRNSWEINDGVVSVVDSTLNSEKQPLVVLNKFHSKTTVDIFKDTGIEVSGDTEKIVDLFLQDKLNLTTILPILSSNEIYFDSSESGGLLYPSLAQNGSLIIDLSSSENLIKDNSLKIKKGVKVYNLTTNQLTNRSFYLDLNSDSANKILNFNTMVPIGSYDLIVNGNDSGKDIFIKFGQVNLIEETLDSDSDNYDLQQVGGTDCDDNNSNIHPGAAEMCNLVDDNCDNQIDENIANLTNGIDVGECQIEIKSCVGGSFQIIQPIISPAQEICDDKDNDCDGLIEEGDLCKVIFINSPTPNFNYSERRINIDLFVNQEVDEIKYINYLVSRPINITLCKNCLGYNKSKIFLEGFNNVTFMAIENNTIIGEENVAFRLDSKEPRISRTTPRGGFASGIFDIEFIEDNPAGLILFYGNNIRNYSLDIGNECVLDRTRYKCQTKVDLEDFDGQEISYWFELSDIAGNVKVSRPIKLNVDTTNPVINSFVNLTNGRRVTFIFNVTKQNFEEINYIDFSASRPREIRLCSRLNNGICSVTKSFTSGSHNLTINVLDKAGNSVQRFMSFVI